MPFKRVITCDACNKELRPGMHGDFHFKLESDGEINVPDNDPKIDVFGAFFCSLNCLREWVKNKMN